MPLNRPYNRGGAQTLEPKPKSSAGNPKRQAASILFSAPLLPCWVRRPEKKFPRFRFQGSLPQNQQVYHKISIPRLKCFLIPQLQPCQRTSGLNWAPNTLQVAYIPTDLQANSKSEILHPKLEIAHPEP